MNKKNFVWLLFSLFLIGSGLAVRGSHAVDGHQLIGIGLALFVILAVTGSFKGGQRNGK